MLTSLLLTAFLLIHFLFGESLLYKYLSPFREKMDLPQRLAIGLGLGIAFHLIFAHSLAFPLQSYSTSSGLALALVMGYLVFALTQKKYKVSFSYITSQGILITLLALLIAICCAIRGHLTDSDNTHIAWMSCIAKNNFYPPALTVDIDYPLSFYHYGIDLIGSSLVTLTKAMPWDAISFQVGIGTFLVFLALYSTVSYFLNGFKTRLGSTLFIFFFTSITSLEYFYKYIGSGSFKTIGDFMRGWQNASLPAVGHFPYNAVLVSQNMSFASLLIFAFILFKTIGRPLKENIPAYVCILPLSFMSYFCYPSYWYPTIAGLGLFALVMFVVKISKGSKFLSLLKSPYSYNFAIVLGIFFLGKFFSFKHGMSFEGINALEFRPSWFWDSFYMQFYSYFDFNPAQDSTVKMVRDYVSGKAIPSVHLFSIHTFRNFGFITLVACVFAFGQAYYKKYTNLLYFFLLGLPGLPIPFLFHFILKPSETYRFPAYSKMVFLIFVTIAFFSILKHNAGFARVIEWKPTKYLIAFHLLLFMIPGIVSISPFLGHQKYHNHELLDEKEKAGIQAMMAIHQQKEIVATTQVFYTFCDVANVAGFFGVGGQWYKPDYTTRFTVIGLLNPLLLEELDVDYVLIDRSDKLSRKAVERLSDRRLFKEMLSVNEANPDWHFYKFLGASDYTAEQIKALEAEYKWVIGSKIAMNYYPLDFGTKGQKKFYISQYKKDLIDKNKNLKMKIAKSNIPYAMWLGPQALPASAVGKL